MRVLLFELNCSAFPGTQDATNGEGRTYLGAVIVTTDSSGNGSFSTVFSGVSLSATDRVSGTATVDLGGGNFGSTSEFSVNLSATANAAPVLDNSGTMTLTSITEDNTTNLVNRSFDYS